MIIMIIMIMIMIIIIIIIIIIITFCIARLTRYLTHFTSKQEPQAVTTAL